MMKFIPALGIVSVLLVAGCNAGANTGTVTIYFCTPAVTPCTAASPGTVASVTSNTVSGGNWATANGAATVSSSNTYTSTAYWTDPDGVQLVSNTRTWTP